MTSRRTARAFSLLEVVLVLALIGIVAAIAVPRHASALARYRAESAARRIAADLEYARSLAESSSSHQIIVFDTAADTYTLVGRSDPDDPGQTYTVVLDESPYHATLAAAGFGGTAKVAFDGFGMPSAGGAVQIQVGPYAYTVSVDAESGAVSVSTATGVP